VNRERLYYFNDTPTIVVSLPFCIKCGQEIPAGDSFCSNCGAPATPVAAAPSVESVLFTTEAYKGIFNPSRHLLFFTDRRLIVAPLPGGELGTSPSLVYNVLADLAQKAGDMKIKQLRQKGIEELLSDKKNRAIPYVEMTSIEVKGSMLGGGQININRAAGSEKFDVRVDFDRRFRIDDFERLLKPVLGDRLTVKR